MGKVNQNNHKIYYINGHKLYKMAVYVPSRSNDQEIFQHLSLQDTPKFTQIGIFGLKNISSGNPGSVS
jgi:hypothetical protein